MSRDDLSDVALERAMAEIAALGREFDAKAAASKRVLQEAELRAEEIVEACKDLTGIPCRGVDISQVELDFRKKRVIVRTQSYDRDEGWTLDQKRIRFPLRWLAMETREVREELSRFLRDRDARRAARLAEETRAEEEARRQRDRTELAEICARLGIPVPG